MTEASESAPAPQPAPEPAPAPQPAPEPSPSPAPAKDDKSLLFQEDKPKEGEEKPATEEKKEGEEKPADEVKYEYKLPEDFAPAQDQLDWLTTTAKEMNIAPEHAQKFVDKYVELKQAELDQWEAVREGWRKEVKEDKEFGGKNFDQSIANANAMVRKFGDSDLVERCLHLGLGDSLPFIRMMNKLHEAIKDDSIEGTEGKSGTASQPKSAEQILWPSMKPNG